MENTQVMCHVGVTSCGQHHCNMFAFLISLLHYHQHDPQDFTLPHLHTPHLSLFLCPPTITGLWHCRHANSSSSDCLQLKNIIKLAPQTQSWDYLDVYCKSNYDGKSSSWVITPRWVITSSFPLLAAECLLPLLSTTPLSSNEHYPSYLYRAPHLLAQMSTIPLTSNKHHYCLKVRLVNWKSTEI